MVPTGCIDILAYAFDPQQLKQPIRNVSLDLTCKVVRAEKATIQIVYKGNLKKVRGFKYKAFEGDPFRHY